MTSEEQTIMEAVMTSRFSPMKQPDGHDHGRTFTALLFALFIAALLFAILAGTSVYRSLFAIRQATDDTRLSLNLIANSVHANDAADAVGVGTGPEGRSLVLVERLESGSYETRIYLNEGNIVEEYALASAPYTPEKATKIAASSQFDFSYEQGVLTITTDQGTANVMLRSVRGGA